MKKFLILIISAFLIFTGCTAPEKKEALDDLNEIIATDDRGVETKTALMYNDPIYGFSLNLPIAWETFQTMNEKKVWTEGIISQVIYFGLGVNDKIFSIEIINKEDWETVN